MKKYYYAILILLTLSSTLYAQEVPDTSPWASVGRMVGRTKITMEYYSPSVRGRTIWDSLVPYGKEWRTGANSGTRITLDDPCYLGKDTLAPGTYLLTTVPGKNEWTIKLKGEKENYETKAKPLSTKEHFENMTFLITAEDDSNATITLRWGKLAVPFTLVTPTRAKMAKALMNQYESWYRLAKSAYYMAKYELEMEATLGWAQKSVELKDDHFYTHWVLAKVYGRMGEYKKAITAAEKALEVGDEKSGFFTSRKKYIEQDLAAWKAKKQGQFWF